MTAIALALTACGQAEPTPDGAGASTSYEQAVLEWRAGRLARLKAPTGFLNQIGLFWLDAGTYSVGSGPDNDIRFPAHAATDIGLLEVAGDGVRMQVNDGIQVLNNDQPVTRILIADDMNIHSLRHSDRYPITPSMHLGGSRRRCTATPNRRL